MQLEFFKNFLRYKYLRNNLKTNVEMLYLCKILYFYVSQTIKIYIYLICVTINIKATIEQANRKRWSI